MAIAPITGKLRKRFWLDVGSALSLGLTGAFSYWYGVHLKALQRQEQYYVKLERERFAQS